MQNLFIALSIVLVSLLQTEFSFGHSRIIANQRDRQLDGEDTDALGRFTQMAAS